YCQRGRAFVMQEVKVRAISEGQAVLEGVPVGTVVALVNPETKRPGQTKEAAGAAPSLGAISNGTHAAAMKHTPMAKPRSLAQWLPDIAFGLQNLATHKLRSLLTMLGMIFGVAAVVAMLSIGAGAQQKVMAFIEQLGVRNLIVEAKEARNGQELQKVRKNSPGLTLKDYQIIRQNVDIQ